MTEPIIDMIKGHSGDYSLNNLLMGYTKNQMMQIADSHGLTLPKSWNKNKLAEALTPQILHQAQTLYQEILDEVLSIIPEKSQNMLPVKDSENLNSFAPLIKKGFFFAVNTGDSYVVIIPAELIDAVNNGRPQEDSSQITSYDGHAEDSANQFSDEEEFTTDRPEQTYDLLLKWKKQLTSIYGNCSSSHLHEIWNRYYPDTLTEEDIVDILSN